MPKEKEQQRRAYEWYPAAQIMVRRSVARTRVAFLTSWYSHRRAYSWTAYVLCPVFVFLLVVHFWPRLNAYLGGIEKSIIPELAIGVGAAVTGIIAIAFSLSLFAIQQVAERGTPATLRAYAKDRVLRLIYWTLAIFATACFGIAILKTETNSRAGAVAAELLMLLGSFFLLNFYFGRVVKFADPRYTIRRIFEDGQQQLKKLQVARDSLDNEVSKGRGETGKSGR